MTVEPPTPLTANRPATAAAPGAAACARTGIVAFALVLAWLVAQPAHAPWGDALRFVVQADDLGNVSLFGNHIGQRIGLHLFVPLGDVLGLTPERSALWLSMVGTAFGLGVAAAAARAFGATALACVGWAFVAALSPSVTLLATVTEVHGVQLAASAVALLLLVVTRDAREPVRWSVALFALALATIGHTSQILLAAPFFAWVALRRGRLAQIAIAAALCALLVGAIGAAAIAFYRHIGPDGYDGTWRPLYVLGRYSAIVLEMRERSGWYGPFAIAEFTWVEVLATGGVVWIALVGVWRRPRERALLALPIGLATYLVVLSQVGIHERGAYFLALFPWLVVAGSRLPSLVPWVLVVAQMPLGLLASLDDAERADAREWVAGVQSVVSSEALTLPLTIYTSDMVRHSAFPTVEGIVVGRMWYYRFEWVPERAWDEVLGADLGDQLEADLENGRVVFDAHCVPGPDDDGRAWQRWTRTFLTERGFDLRPFPWPVDALGPAPSDAVADRFLFEVVRTADANDAAGR